MRPFFLPPDTDLGHYTSFRVDIRRIERHFLGEEARPDAWKFSLSGGNTVNVPRASLTSIETLLLTQGPHQAESMLSL